jgi:hypothetical protein
MEKVALVFGVTNDGSAPPIRQRSCFIRIVKPKVGITMTGERVIVFVRVKLHEQADLFQVIQAGNPFAFRLGPREHRQKQSRQNGDDGDNDQKFNQSKGALPSFRPPISSPRIEILLAQEGSI